MSKAEELANELNDELKKRVSHVVFLPASLAAASETELRRLAQVEAEHAALKEELEAEREETKRWLKKAVDLKDVADEYKKLAEKILAEHAALLKAISDAEPVAWSGGIEWHPIKHYQSEQVQKLTRKEQKEYGFTIPLYTLNGIKKP